MSEPFLAEIRIVGFTFAPRGWAFCDGQILPINQNQSLYSLLGTNYGGNGRTDFALPDLRGRTPIHVGSSGGAAHPLAQKSGEEAHTLVTAEIPSHNHQMKASNQAVTQPTATNNYLGQSSTSVGSIYSDENVSTNLTPLAPSAITTNAGGQAHENMQPFLALNFCIALRGLFPSRN